MPLTEFCYIPSVATDAFYTPEEQAIHNRLVRLYTLRMREKDGQNRKWRVSSINFCQVEILVLTNNQLYDIIALSSRRW